MRSRFRSLLVPVLAAVCASGLLAGCGGGDEPERLSAAAFDRAAGEVCAAGKEESDRLRGQAAPGARGEAAGKEIDATRAALVTQIDGFEDLRGPADTDDDLEALLTHLRAAAAGLERLRDAAVDDDLTVDEAVQANREVVRQVNRASAQAADDLVALDWLTCIGVTG